MPLNLEITDAKKERRSANLDGYIAAGSIPHKKLESLTGRLSYSQTSIFGRFGRAMMQPLYRKCYADYYDPDISGQMILNFQWWADIVRHAKPRTIYPRRKTPQMVIYTDAATETMVMAANVFDVRIYKRTKRMEACRKTKAASWRGRICKEQNANLICVLEMDPAVLTVSDKSLDLDNKCITYYIDNNAAKCGLIKADSEV